MSNISIIEASFVTSAPSLKEAPVWRLPEITLLGRSNVGKSTLINAMTQRKNLAHTSNTPGKTRLMNFYKMQLAKGKNHPKQIEFAFVDLPGYGYAKVSKTEQAQWQKNLTAYLNHREQIALCIQLIDARHGAQDSDIAMFGWLAQAELPQLVVLTKTDKLDNKRELPGMLAKTAEQLGIDEAHVIPFSGVKPDNRDTLWGVILEALKG